ncbi:MAG: ABC transporter ATP-binding protein [Ignavibacteriales bacterium]|nr:MAG: ABC transporter ATP-binding protein [Ignavibacteriales bacterium]
MLELRNIKKSYGKSLIVKNVNLTINDGEFFALLGPSGCGKTTLLRMIAGFEKPTEGEIILNGKVINDILPFKRDVHTVFQNYALFPNLTVFDNVAYGLKIKKLPPEKIKEDVENIMSTVGLEGFSSRMPSQLSGGQQQRVALARALVNKPSVLLLDEPLSALDKKVSEQMRLELSDIQKRIGITFIYVTHNQLEALTMADRIAVMKDGLIEQCDTAVNIYENPATYFTAAFIGYMNFLKGTVAEVNTEGCKIKLMNDFIISRNGKFDFTAGQEITFGIRPQQLKLSLIEPKPYENGIAGKVEHRIYIGDLTQYYLKLETGDTVQINYSNYLMNEANMLQYEVGEELFVNWSKTTGNILYDKN